MCTFLNASADINTQVEQSEQGTVSVETTFSNHCNLNLDIDAQILSKTRNHECRNCILLSMQRKTW